ncbi:MAG: hypothetical protein JSV35_04515 [Candidatus Bathyarchaeota archaeon]|nr:MAG: hypothetical protein JSV35_04515 [Candidatus Bathyarchaeota archaeon]
MSSKTEVSDICPSQDPIGVVVDVEVSSLLGVRLAEGVESGETVTFDVKARMEERKRVQGSVLIGFVLKVGTKPSVVKYEVEGTAQLQGRDNDVKTMLEADPNTRVPLIFHRVYKQVFMSMYLLSTLVNAPPPPADLLGSSERQVAPRIQMSDESEPSREESQLASSEVAEGREQYVPSEQEDTYGQPEDVSVDSEEDMTPVEDVQIRSSEEDLESQDQPLTQEAT